MGTLDPHSPLRTLRNACVETGVSFAHVSSELVLATRIEPCLRASSALHRARGTRGLSLPAQRVAMRKAAWSSWQPLDAHTRELSLRRTLLSGQSFRWRVRPPSRLAQGSDKE